MIQSEKALCGAPEVPRGSRVRPWTGCTGHAWPWGLPTSWGSPPPGDKGLPWVPAGVPPLMLALLSRLYVFRLFIVPHAPVTQGTAVDRCPGPAPHLVRLSRMLP